MGFDIAWSFGGGTALMLQIDHRDSFDIDVFIDDPQLLPFLNTITQGHELDVWPDDYRTDGTKTLKLVFTGLGEIDFICAAELTETPSFMRPLFEEMVRLETPAEIISKKVYYRGASLQP
ncbi:MAG TPA: nucleotidyl transferase AbiEii/AbiGii toxin family protein, partial [Ensifer sp.]|nr:nucleotidyl transferase AbiEii/AbiGii toxin family protein [Ensifer sp.]